MKTHSNPAIAASLFAFFCLPVLFCSALPPTVTFVAGTSAGWDFQERDGDIARNNVVDLTDLSILAQNWLASDCGTMNQWCQKADIDASTGVDFADYSILANNWSLQSGQFVLLQTIYGTGQDANGTIISNTTRALQSLKGMAMAFTVPSNTTLDKGIFKLVTLKKGYDMEVRLYNVTGKGFLTYNHTMTRSDPGSGSSPIVDVTLSTPSTVPYHMEGTLQISDMVINLGPKDVNTGEYLIVFDTVATNVTTSCNMVKGTGTQPATMGVYPDGSTLPKRATVTTSSATGNTYYYYLYSSTDVSYTPASDLFAFQIITANKTPIVNAGLDQTITWPLDTVTLVGTASDDGLPNPPGEVTAHWTKQSGPGEVFFYDENAASTTATLTLPGTYVLRLTANDGQLTAHDDITVTCVSLNQPPAVEAGKNKIIVNPVNFISLHGTATDDGKPNPPAAITTLWTMQSGPGTVTFTDANALSTTATFSNYGTYVLRLTANDSEFANHDDVMITYLEFPPPNQAPVVDAGMDKQVVLPTMALLNGTVADDNWPDPPGVVAALWTQQSGPDTAAITDATAAVATASFPQPGTYVFRLTATDSDLTSFDDVTIEVLPPVDQMVYHVTNLSNSGTGSLADCVSKANTDGVRSRIVFDVDGTIHPTASFKLTEPNTTICGTEAPSPGITLDFGGVSSGFSVPDTSGGMRFCNISVRNTAGNSDGISLFGNNSTVERCTFTYCRDEGVGMSGSYGNTVVFSRFDYCGSQSSPYPDGRATLVMGGSATVVGNAIYHCNRGITINSNGFMDLRHNLINDSLSPNSGSGFTNAGVSSNAIDNVANHNPCSGFNYKDHCHFYRSGNTGTDNAYMHLDVVPPDQTLEFVYDGCTEVFSPITYAGLPFPVWLVEKVTTPASSSEAGMGTGPCQCIVAR